MRKCAIIFFLFMLRYGCRVQKSFEFIALNKQDKTGVTIIDAPSIYDFTDCEREDLLRANLRLKKDRGLQKRKTTDITVTTIGRADPSALPQYEQTVLFSALLKRVNELMRGGENK